MGSMKDYRHFYRDITAGIRQSVWKRQLLIGANTGITVVIYLLYPLLLLYLLMSRDNRLATFIWLPALAFGLVSLYRRLINTPRPYESWDIEPLISKDTTGQSFPSRHVFSASLIGMCFWQVNLWLGLLILVMAVILAVARVLAGIHYPRDVLAGFLVGIICGALLFFLR